MLESAAVVAIAITIAITTTAIVTITTTSSLPCLNQRFSRHLLQLHLNLLLVDILRARLELRPVTLFCYKLPWSKLQAPKSSSRGPASRQSEESW